MRFKLDENFGKRTQEIFQSANHDVQTVSQKSLHGIEDDRLFELCKEEGRCLVTLDLDFANVLRFPPEKAAGLAVFRLPRNPSLQILEQLVYQFLGALHDLAIEKKLWIVEVGRIRVHQSRLD